MDIYLVDGTYELFRHYYALPSARDSDGCEVAAVRGVLASMPGMIKEDASHIAVATDHVIESFRNDLWPSYKTGEGIEPDLLAQFPLLEEVLSAAGVVVWPMVEFEADDALAAAAVAAGADERVDRVVIESIPKDCREWRVNATNASALADTLCREWDHALLFRRLATLRTDIRLFEDVDQLRWSGPTRAFDELAARLDSARTAARRQLARRSMNTPILRSAARR